MKLLDRKRLQELENVELTELGKQEITDRYAFLKGEREKVETDKKAEEELLKKEQLLELEELQ